MSTLFDAKALRHKKQYVLQCILATLTIIAILLFLDVLTETAIITALGASAFILFTKPKSYSSQPRRLIGGYLVGVTIGLLCYYLSQVQNLFQLESSTSVLIVFGALAVGLSFFIMAITNTEHAPAVGMALGLVINPWGPLTLVFIFCAVLWMSGVRWILHPFLMDLTSPRERS